MAGLIGKMQHYINNGYHYTGHKPRNLPVTQAEIIELISECRADYPAKRADSPAEFANVPVHETYYGPLIRELKLKQDTYISECDEIEIKEDIDQLRLNLKARILS